MQIDDPCDDTLSLTTAQMIAVNRSEEDKMHLVLGPQCINRTEKIAAVFSGAKIFQIHPTGSSRALYQTAHRGPVELVGYSEQQAVDFSAIMPIITPIANWRWFMTAAVRK